MEYNLIECNLRTEIKVNKYCIVNQIEFSEIRIMW